MILNTELNQILRNVADNFLISLDSTFDKFYYGLDAKLWLETNNNPILFLKKYKKNISLDNYDFNIDDIIKRYYALENSTIAKSGKTIAYFSPEFGFHESFPNYAGGLGILAGDVIKTAALNNLNMIGVGLLYSKGYFVQRITDNKQKSIYRRINLNNLPLEKLLNKEGEEVRIELQIEEETIIVVAYRLRINKSSVILLSTDIEENGKMREITHQLYTGNRYLRLLQEIILGFGGVRILDAAGIKIEQYHINEGHASFAIWERAALYSQKNSININEALEILKESTVFTTHTPVIHGNEEFEINILKVALRHIIYEYDTNYKYFINLGKTKSENKDVFSMTAFGINLSGISNGVSQLHCQTASKMWSGIYESNKKIKPMTFVTNGIHFDSWMADEIRQIIENNQFNQSTVLDIVDSLPSETLLKLKQDIKFRVFDRLSKLPQLGFGNSFFRQNKPEDLKNSLVIGFARRFAPYKQADLIFSNTYKLMKIIENTDVPVVFIFSGKAHPKDTDGKKLLSRVVEKINFDTFNNHILFVPDYDILVGRLLVQGCDVWLNNPQKPLEACGTSGMKSALNFGINISVDDGWWYEAFNGKNGYSLDGTLDKNHIADIIYNLIGNEVIPDYSKYVKFENSQWTKMMKQSFRTIYQQFSSERMLSEYSDSLYTK